MDTSAFTAIFDALPDPALVVRAEPYSAARRVIMANTAAREIFRIAEPQPMIASVIRRPDLLDLVEGALNQAVRGEVEWDSGMDQDRRLRALVRPLPPQADGARLALVIVRDETDARRNERMRADFLANASHELKTPLASLQGFIETLRGHARDDEQAREHFLSIMAGQADRMSRLVADLMSLSRIELNEHIRPSGEVELMGCARDVVDSLAPIAEAAQVTIDITGSGPFVVSGDRHQILQVIQNLVENAIKHSRPGAIVRVELIPSMSKSQAESPTRSGTGHRTLLSADSATGARFAAIRVKDEGAGISREHLPRLTERFYRAPGQKSGETSGTGLGLAIVKHILNRHRGGLYVESALGIGSVFTAYFPQE